MSSKAQRSVYELAPAQFGTVAGLYAPVWFDRAQIDSALEGRQQARVFVDRLPEPRAAMVCHGYDYYPAGDPESPDLRRFIAEAPGEAGVFASFYGYCPADPAWEAALLADHVLQRIVRRTFLYLAKVAPTAQLGTEYVLRLPDVELARRIDAELDEHITLTWGSYEAFASAGLGCCVLKDGQVVSAAFPASVSAHHADISVATLPAVRRRGLAEVACATVIAQYLAGGRTVAWDTDDDNEASARLALRLGFVEQPPFVELATPGRRHLDLSHGVWHQSPASVPDSPGATIWTAQY
jgi:RimJ/RimL family protein N-acetyltransferase